MRKWAFFGTDDPDTAAYAAEYNRILNDKMPEGFSNLVRERYLAFSVGASSVDSAVPKLARMRTDAMQTLAKIRSGARMLDGLATLFGTISSETEACLPELDRAHVAQRRMHPLVVVPPDVVV